MTTESTVANKKIQIGHTPDPDDAYMFYGYATGKVSIPDHEIVHVLEDIQSLNQRALRNEIEVTAVSAAVYPQIHQNYWIMPSGASVGRNYGPVVVKLKGSQPSGKRIGIPGKFTTAFLLLRLYTKGYEPVEYAFDAIPDALKKGEIDFGLLIHEAQLTYAETGFEKIINLGEAWFEETGLPIPLGLDVIRKDLGRDFAKVVANSFRDSIVAADNDPKGAIAYALKYGRGLETDLGQKFVKMYVNDDTLDLPPECEKALQILFDKGHRAGIFANPTPIDVLR